MATGDSNDILTRVKLVLPGRWWSYVAPFRDAVLGGLSDGAAWCYSWFSYAVTQSRIATSTGPFLDLIAYDFLGRYLVRGGSSDNVFRTRILMTILQERVTRAGMISALTQLTGNPPVVFEPWNTGDAGGYGCGNFAYGQSGGWGSINLPGQVFLKVTRTTSSGIPFISGYGQGAGGYGKGTIEYVGSSISQDGVTDNEIYQTILTTKPVGVTCWTQIN
jgi:hypothetical protein